MKILEEFIIRHLKKSKRKIWLYNYREKNKDRVNAISRKSKNKKKNKKKQKKKETDKKYYQKNKEKIKIKTKIYTEKNKEKISIKKKKWRENNKDAIKKYRENNHNKFIISDWKRNGVKSDNYDLLYEKWINTKNCENCNVVLTTGKRVSTSKCLDHSHITGEFRNILCCACNTKRGETNI